MLVLSRKTDESILIDGRIEVTVVQIEGGRVRLGINAPREIAIRRSELEPRNDPAPRREQREVRESEAAVPDSETAFASH